MGANTRTALSAPRRSRLVVKARGLLGSDMERPRRAGAVARALGQSDRGRAALGECPRDQAAAAREEPRQPANPASGATALRRLRGLAARAQTLERAPRRDSGRPRSGIAEREERQRGRRRARRARQGRQRAAPRQSAAAAEQHDALIALRHPGGTLQGVAILRRRMSRNQRIGLIVAAIVFAVVAFVIASPGGDDDGGEQADPDHRDSRVSSRETDRAGDADGDRDRAGRGPAEPSATQIQIRGGEVVGGPADITVKKGDRVRIVVSSDAPDDIHLHGYDIEKEVEPGQAGALQVHGRRRGDLRDREPRGRGRGRRSPSSAS